MGKRSAPEKADIAVARAASPARHNPTVKALGWISEIADQPPLITLCALSAAAGVLLRRPRLAHTGARMLAGELVATRLKSMVKHRVDRTRPHVLADGGRYRASAGHHDDPALNSFPSGHMAGAVAVARAPARGYPEHAATAYLGAAAIGAIQVPRSRHYPTDVAAGAVIGLVAEALVAAGSNLATTLAFNARARTRTSRSG